MPAHTIAAGQQALGMSMAAIGYALHQSTSSEVASYYVLCVLLLTSFHRIILINSESAGAELPCNAAKPAFVSASQHEGPVVDSHNQLLPLQDAAKRTHLKSHGWEPSGGFAAVYQLHMLLHGSQRAQLQ
jgi:hypothetical protein